MTAAHATVRWFGQPWWSEAVRARICEPGFEVPVPVGQVCPMCQAAIKATDRGLTVPYLGMLAVGTRPYHLGCFMAFISAPSASTE